MKMLLKSAVAAAVLAIPSLAMAAEWVADPAHSGASFTVKHMMVTNVRGQFEKVSATLNLDDKDITKSTVEATIDAASINTHQAKRDGHLKSPDFFDVAKYPTLTFKSKKVEKAGEGKLKVTGDFTMRGVTKEVVLDVTGPGPEVKDVGRPSFVRKGASATTQINRKDFGLNWNVALEAGGLMVGDEVKIELDLALVRDTAAPAAPAAAKDAK
jgi:polyisoprenoid-binding protein YceI